MRDIEPLQTSAVRAAQLIWENGLLKVINRVSPFGSCCAFH